MYSIICIEIFNKNNQHIYTTMRCAMCSMLCALALISDRSLGVTWAVRP